MIKSEFDYVEHEESATDFSNLIFGVDDNEQCFNESNSTKIRIGKFEKSLKQVSPQSKDSFYNAVICSLYFNIVKAELLSFNEQNTQIALGLDFISRLNELKDRIRLSVEMNDFEPKMHLVNDLVFEKKMFLRLFEKKSKFRYLIKKGNEKKNEIKKEVLACIDMHYNGFNVSCHLCNKDQQIEFQPVDIICKPVKRVDEIIECFYSAEIFQAFTIRLQGKSRISTHTGHLCYYCNDYCAGNQSFEGQLKSCTRKPGVVYKFNNANLSTFEDKYGLMGEKTFSIYFDLETTCGRNVLLPFDENDQTIDMYAVFYCIVVYFHKSYAINELAIVRSFTDSLQDLADLS